MSERIIILEQDPDIRSAMASALTAAGYGIVSPADAAEAREMVWDAYDVAIVDLDWEDIAAGDMIRRLETLTPEIVVIVTGAESPAGMIRRAAGFNAASFLAKPVEPAQVQWEVARCLEIRQLQHAEKTVTRLSHAVNSAYDGIVLADLNGRITYTNQAVQELFGYAGKELIGKGVEVLNRAYTENREMIGAMLAKDGWSGEIMTIRKDGSWFPILLSTSLVRDEGGQPVALMGIVKDLSEVKKAEAEIARRNLELSALNQVTGALSQSFDFDEVVTIALERVIEATGLEMGAVHLLDAAGAELVMAASSGLPPEYASVIQRVKTDEHVFGQVFQSGRPVYTENAQQDRKLGPVISPHLDVAAFAMVPLHARDRIIGMMSVGSRRPHHLDDHEIGLIVTMGRQIGLALEKARLFRQVSRDKREWEDTFDAITDLISVQDADGRIMRVNRSLIDRLGQPADRLVGQPWYLALLRPGSTRDWAAPMVKQGNTSPVVEEIDDLAVEGTFLLSVFPRFDELKRIGSVVVIRDVSDHRRLEEQIRRLDRLSSLGELSAGIAHEIRNPLSSVKLDTQLLARQLAGDPRRRKIVGNILDAIEKIEQVVRSTLNYARPEEPAFQRFSLCHVIDQSLDVVQAQLKKAGIISVFERPNPPPLVFIDPNQIQQVFVNLFLNAVHAMPGGGRLEIRMEHGYNMVSVEISDTGVGIAPENLSKIFNPFFTTRSQGTGLGLSIVQRIMERHQASVEVNSRIDSGTTFVLCFPLRVNQAQYFRPHNRTDLSTVEAAHEPQDIDRR